jgi:hypothetical protein
MEHLGNVMRLKIDILWRNGHGPPLPRYRTRETDHSPKRWIVVPPQPNGRECQNLSP